VKTFSRDSCANYKFEKNGRRKNQEKKEAERFLPKSISTDFRTAQKKTVKRIGKKTSPSAFAKPHDPVAAR